MVARAGTAGCEGGAALHHGRCHVDLCVSWNINHTIQQTLAWPRSYLTICVASLSASAARRSILHASRVSSSTRSSRCTATCGGNRRWQPRRLVEGNPRGSPNQRGLVPPRCR